MQPRIRLGKEEELTALGVVFATLCLPLVAGGALGGVEVGVAELVPHELVAALHRYDGAEFLLIYVVLAQSGWKKLAEVLSLFAAKASRS